MEKEPVGEILPNPVFVILPWDGRAGFIVDGKFLPEDPIEPREGAVFDGFHVKDGTARAMWKKA